MRIINSSNASGENGLTTMLYIHLASISEKHNVMTPTKNDPQELDSAITYQRRYTLEAI